MDTELTEEQAELADAVRTLLERRAGSAAVRSAMAEPAGDTQLWRTLAEEVGIAAIAVPEEYGGFGATVFESHLVLEQLGEALAVVPALGSGVLATQAILAGADEDARTRLLPSLASGEQTGALAWADARGRWSPETVDVAASLTGDDWTLDGATPLVLDGASADVVIVIAGTPSGPGLFEVVDTASLERVATPAVDPTLRFATLRFARTAARPLSLGDDAALDRIRVSALVAISALQTGAAARGLSMTLAYAGQRTQFGRLIGSFQALKHRLADMHVQLESARSISRAAARAIAADDPDAARLSRMAKAWCGDALDLIAGETIQLHGGIGITWEHDAQLVFKRAHALSQLFGQASDQRAQLATALGLT